MKYKESHYAVLFHPLISRDMSLGITVELQIIVLMQILYKRYSLQAIDEAGHFPQNLSSRIESKWNLRAIKTGRKAPQGLALYFSARCWNTE